MRHCSAAAADLHHLVTALPAADLPDSLVDVVTEVEDAALRSVLGPDPIPQHAVLQAFCGAKVGRLGLRRFADAFDRTGTYWRAVSEAERRLLRRVLTRAVDDAVGSLSDGDVHRARLRELRAADGAAVLWATRTLPKLLQLRCDPDVGRTALRTILGCKLQPAVKKPMACPSKHTEKAPSVDASGLHCMSCRVLVTNQRHRAVQCMLASQLQAAFGRDAVKREQAIGEDGRPCDRTRRPGRQR